MEKIDVPYTEIPVYKHSADHARDVGDLQLYRMSHQANEDCKQAIEKAIREHFDGMHLDKSCVSPVIDKFGPERVSHVLALTLQQKEYDGRFSRNNKEWAKAIPIEPDISLGVDRNAYLAVETHPAVLDGFVQMARQEIAARERPRLKALLSKVTVSSARTSPKAPKPTHIPMR